STDVLIDAGPVLPDQRPGLGVEREDIVVAADDVHHTILHDRRSFERIFRTESRTEMRNPGALQVLDVRSIDLGESRIPGIMPIAADGEPFLACGLAKVPITLSGGNGRTNAGKTENGASQ